MKIICVGRNYAAHAKELNNEVPKEPVLFIKPATALITADEIPYPSFASSLHYEVEVVVKITQTAKDVSLSKAHEYFDEIALGIDFTDRHLQSQLKSKGLPWEKAKAFDSSAFVSPFLSKQAYNLDGLHFALQKNKRYVQQADTSQMLFSLEQLIVESTRYFTLEAGDLLFTGTPQGVGEVKIGDELIGSLEEKELFTLKIC